VPSISLAPWLSVMRALGFGALRYHRHIEAARLAYRDGDAFVADPSQVDVPVKKSQPRHRTLVGPPLSPPSD
jgi:gamma-glutamyltranspeptidase